MSVLPRLSPYILLVFVVYLLYLFGIIHTPGFVLAVMYLLSRWAGGGGYERGKDEDGFEMGGGHKPNVGFSMVQGRRPYMEDFTFSKIDFGSSGNSSFFGVFDGHSGKRAAMWAKEYLGRNLDQMLQNSDPENALVGAFLKTDGDFLAQAAKEGLGDGSTVTTALLLGRELFVANAGDSRTILCHGSTALAMSEDHKPDRPSERRRIVQNGGTVLYCGCARVNGVLATSRGFGDKELKKWVSAEPEIKQRTLVKGDDFLVLASDGLWDVMSSNDAAAIVHRERNPHLAAKKLTAEALRLGSMDNVTALVVDLRPLFEVPKEGKEAVAALSSPFKSKDSAAEDSAAAAGPRIRGGRSVPEPQGSVSEDPDAATPSDASRQGQRLGQPRL